APTDVTFTLEWFEQGGNFLIPHEETASVPLTVRNVAPTITGLSVPGTAAEGRVVDLSATATDPPGAGDPLRCTCAGTPPHGSVHTTVTGPSASFVPADSGGYGVSLTVTDGDGGATQSAHPNLKGWWGGEGTARGYQGVNNGSLTGGVSYAEGKVGQAFSFS